MRPTLSAAEKKLDLPFEPDNAVLRFNYIHPDFVERFGNPDKWVNVIQFQDWTFKNKMAMAYPIDYKKPLSPRLRQGSYNVLPTTEGFVVIQSHCDAPGHFKIDDGTTAISKWLKANGVEAILSDAGRTTQQIIQTLGGFHGVSSFAHPEIVKFLNEISRRPVSPSAPHREFSGRIQSAIKGDVWRGHNFESLVELGAVELGLKLKCSICSSWNWYSFKELGYQVNCKLCLRDFKFPVVDPGSNKLSKWAYRLVGPFALPNYANGGYAASLSIRFFSEVIGHLGSADVTWSGGQELSLTDDHKVESDYIIWYQRKVFLGNNYPTEIVFGEAKSFGKDVFKANDIDRMKELAVRFPGSILVFSMMKKPSELSSDEVSRLTKLANWGRKYIKDKQQIRAPVIVLTGVELFASYSLENAWKEMGGKHELVVNSAFRLDNLRELADLTQQLYLNMPSYTKWLEDKWKKKRQKP